MLRGEGNAGERWKTAIGLISKKNNFARAAHFFCTFICLCFARLQRETSGNFLVTRFMEERSYVFSFTFFHCRSFSPCIGGRLHFSFCHRCYKIFLLFFQQKKCLLCFFFSALVLCRPFFLVELRLPAAYFPFSLYFSVGHRNNFRFPFSSLLTL